MVTGGSIGQSVTLKTRYPAGSRATAAKKTQRGIDPQPEQRSREKAQRGKAPTKESFSQRRRVRREKEGAGFGREPPPETRSPLRPLRLREKIGSAKQESAD